MFLSTGPELFFFAQLKTSIPSIEVSDNDNDIIGKVVNGFKQPKVRIFIWAVHGS